MAKHKLSALSGQEIGIEIASVPGFRDYMHLVDRATYCALMVLPTLLRLRIWRSFQALA